MAGKAQRRKSDLPAHLPHYRIRLDLHQNLRRDQRAHLHHRRGRTDLAKEFPVRLPNLFPLPVAVVPDTCTYEPTFTARE